MTFVTFDVCHIMTFVCYEVCRIMTFVGYDVCRIMMFVAYDIFECVAYRVCRSYVMCFANPHKLWSESSSSDQIYETKQSKTVRCDEYSIVFRISTI